MKSALVKNLSFSMQYLLMRKVLYMYPIILVSLLILASVSMLPTDMAGELTGREQGNMIALFWFAVLIVLTIVYVITTKMHENLKKRRKRTVRRYA